MSSPNPRNDPALIGLAVFLGAAIAGLFVFLLVYYQQLGSAISAGLFIAVLVLGRLFTTYVQWLRGARRRHGKARSAPDQDDNGHPSAGEPHEFHGKELSEADLPDEDKR